MFKNHLRNYLVGSLGRSVDLLEDPYQHRKTQKHTPVFRISFETILRVPAEGDTYALDNATSVMKQTCKHVTSRLDGMSTCIS
jgi:hypothetical protein